MTHTITSLVVKSVPAHPAPIPGRDILFFEQTYRIPRRTLSVSHVLIIHIITEKIKLIFEF